MLNVIVLYKTNLNKYKIRIFYMFYQNFWKTNYIYHFQYQPQVSPFFTVC